MTLPASVCIRAVTRNDLDGLLALYAELNPADPALTPQRAAECFAQIEVLTGMSILAAFDGNAPVSTCTLVIVPNLTRGGAPYALIENVVTHRDRRRQGIGKALLRHATAEAFAKGCYKVMLLTGKQEASTHAFYTDCGFRQDKTGYQVRHDRAVLKTA